MARKTVEKGAAGRWHCAQPRVTLGVGAFEVSLRHHRWPAMAGAGDKEHREVILIDQPVKVRVDQVESRRRAPMAQQTRFDVCLCQGHVQQRVVLR